MNTFSKILLIITALFYSQTSFAGSSVPTPIIAVPIPIIPGGVPIGNQTILSESNETVASVGLRLEFGDVIKPSIVGTVRHTETDIDNDVTGALAEVAVPLTPDGFFTSTFRIMGIFGDTDVQGLAGVGFDFGDGQALIGIGAQTDYVDGGVNFKLDGTVTPYVGGSSYDGPSNRNETVVRRRLTAMPVPGQRPNIMPSGLLSDR